jgi:hypothetical protein
MRSTVKRTGFADPLCVSLIIFIKPEINTGDIGADVTLATEKQKRNNLEIVYNEWKDLNLTKFECKYFIWLLNGHASYVEQKLQRLWQEAPERVCWLLKLKLTLDWICIGRCGVHSLRPIEIISVFFLCANHMGRAK